MQYDPILVAKCREILQRYEDVLQFVFEEINKEADVRINGEDAFAYAKEYIRREGIREGAKLMINKVHKYANVVTE